MVHLSPQLCGVAALALPVLGGLGAAVAALVGRAQRKASAEQALAIGKVEEVLRSLRTVRLFGRGEDEASRHAEAAAAAAKAGNTIARLSGGAEVCGRFIVCGTLVAVIGAGGGLIEAGVFAVW